MTRDAEGRPCRGPSLPSCACRDQGPAMAEVLAVASAVDRQGRAAVKVEVGGPFPRKANPWTAGQAGVPGPPALRPLLHHGQLVTGPQQGPGSAHPRSTFT